MTIDTLQHAKDFHTTDDMLYPLAGMRQHPVLLALFRREGRRSRRLVGGDGVSVTSPQALIPCISDQGRIMGKPKPRGTKQLQIMDCSGTRGGAQDVLGHGADQQLKLQRVALLLAAVPAALFFFGRSQGTSEASTATML